MNIEDKVSHIRNSWFPGGVEIQDFFDASPSSPIPQIEYLAFEIKPVLNTCGFLSCTWTSVGMSSAAAYYKEIVIITVIISVGEVTAEGE